MNVLALVWHQRAGSCFTVDSGIESRRGAGKESEGVGGGVTVDASSDRVQEPAR